MFTIKAWTVDSQAFMLWSWEDSHQIACSSSFTNVCFDVGNSHGLRFSGWETDDIMCA